MLYSGVPIKIAAINQRHFGAAAACEELLLVPWIPDKQVLATGWSVLMTCLRAWQPKHSEHRAVASLGASAK